MTEIQITPKYCYVKPEGHYVYLHKKSDSGEVFYVGKGQRNRAWHRSRKSNKHWKHTALKHGVIVDIVRDGMSHECALTLEKIMIDLYGFDNLTNLTKGGEGNVGYVTPPEVRAKQSAAKKGKKRGPVPKHVRDKISKSHIGLRPSPETLIKLRESHLGQRKREENNKFDPTIRIFNHDDYGPFIGCSYDLRMKYDIGASCVTNIVKGNQKSAKGWTYIGEYDNDQHQMEE